jgi:hypothetical protein
MNASSAAPKNRLERSRLAAIQLPLLILLVLVSCSTSESQQVGSDVLKPVSGRYVAVSESEWSQELQLNADGTAELTNARWNAGASKNAVSHTYSGQWALDGDKISLHILESKTDPGSVPRAEELRYVAQLSLEEIGRTESLPGVLNVQSSAKDSPLWRATMWREDALRALRWP